MRDGFSRLGTRLAAVASAPEQGRGVRHRTAVSRKLEVVRRHKWLECKRIRFAPLWHNGAHHFETRAVRRASGAVSR